MFWTYVLYNKTASRIYIGQTNNPIERLKRHNGWSPHSRQSYTSKFAGNWDIVFTEEFQTRNEAKAREKQLKSQKGREYIWKTIQNW